MVLRVGAVAFEPDEAGLEGRKVIVDISGCEDLVHQGQGEGQDGVNVALQRVLLVLQTDGWPRCLVLRHDVTCLSLPV